jgi:hypothetical protein
MVDGFATLEQIKKNERLRHCKVIFPQQKEKDIKKGLSLGANLCDKAISIKKSGTSTGINSIIKLLLL